MSKTFYHTDWANDITKVDWDLGNQCNLNCSYCPPNTKQGNFSNPNIETLKVFAESMLDYYHSLGKQLVISFGASGEPTILEHFPTLLKFLHNRVHVVSVRTNLTADLDWWKEYGYLIQDISCTIHYQGNITIKSFYDKIIYISENSQKFSISVAMIPDRFNEQLDDILWLERRSNIKVNILPMLENLYQGGIWINYTNEQKEEFKKRNQFDSHAVITHNDDQTVTNDIESKSSFDVVFSERDEERCFTGWTCYAGIDTLIIDSRGYVRRGWCAQLASEQTHMTQWKWDKNPITCNMAWCRMHHDLLARKTLL